MKSVRSLVLVPLLLLSQGLPLDANPAANGSRATPLAAAATVATAPAFGRDIPGPSEYVHPLIPERIMTSAKTAAALDGTSPEMSGGNTGPNSGGRGAWLRDSRFAMFIHWGLYSELAGQWQGKNYYGIAEWIMNRAQIPAADYAKVAERFNPTDFNAREWVRLAKAAGMRHIMITAKHHEGFAMFKSAASPFNIVDATPFKRDPLKELAAACREEGLRLGFYYSQTADWHEPDAVGNTWDAFPAQRDFQRYLKAKAIPQIQELLRNYGSVAGIWFDTPGPIKPEQSRMLVDLVHELQPQCLVNSRIGNGLGDYDTLGDQEIPRLPRPGLWETVDTHNDTWGYAVFDQNWKSPQEIVERLVRVVSRGGTYMLNVGPDGKGCIPQESARILREVGKWVAAHESAIHGAGPTPLGPLAWGECTTRGQTLFLHVFHWPADGQLVVPGLKSTVKSATLSDCPDTVSIEPLPEGVRLRVPKIRPDVLVPVVVLEMQGPITAERELYVFNHCVNRLEGGIAQPVNCSIGKISWMEKFGDWKHAECLQAWQGRESNASWNFRTLEPGTFYLDIEYTCPEGADYSEWSIEHSGAVRPFPLLDTGEREHRALPSGTLPRFRTYRVGVFDLNQAGVQQLTLRPMSAAGKSVHVSSLILTPME